MIRTYDLYTFLKKNARMLLSFVLHFLIIISLFLLCDASSRDRKVCVREDIQDLARSCSGRRVCLKKRIVKKNLNNVRDQLEQLKMDIESLGRQHKEDLKKILSALLRLEEKKGSHEETTTKKHPKTTTTTKAPEHRIVRSCADAMGTSKVDGIYEIRIPRYSYQPFKVACKADAYGGKGWTVFLRRMDGSVDFHRKWANYKAGFGNLNGEFFLGLDKLHAITNDQSHELMVLLENWDGRVANKSYDQFSIGNEIDKYRLHTLGYARGDLSNALAYHRGKYFSTEDRDNDEWQWNCAKYYTGGWWYGVCHTCNLMGKYRDYKWGQGIVWDGWSSYFESSKGAIMMLRPIKLGAESRTRT